MTIHKLTADLLPDEVNTDLIAALEDLMDQAKKGEVIALAWAGVKRNDDLISGWEGSGGTIWQTGASIMVLHSRYASYMKDNNR